MSVLVNDVSAGSEVGKTEVPPPLSPISVAMQDDQLQQRWIANRVKREAEVRTVQFDGETTIGFITGLDTGSIQMSETRYLDEDGVMIEHKRPKSVLVPRAGTKLEETGKKLQDYPYPVKSAIRGWAYAFRQTCLFELKRAQYDSDEEEEPEDQAS